MEGAESYARPNGDLYFGRKWGEHSDVMALRKAREMTMKSFAGEGGSPMFALIYGAPGCGKTAMVEAAFGEDVVTLMGTGDTEVADLVGGYVQTPSGGFDWVDGGLIDAAVNGKVYFIDEIGLIDPKVLSLAYGLMDGRRELVVTANPERGTIKAHENFWQYFRYLEPSCLCPRNRQTCRCRCADKGLWGRGQASENLTPMSDFR